MKTKIALLSTVLIVPSLFAATATHLETEAAKEEEVGRYAKAQKLWAQAGAQRLKEAEVFIVKGEKPEDPFAIGDLTETNLGDGIDVFDEMTNGKEAIQKQADLKASFFTIGALDFEKGLESEKADKAFALADKVPGQSAANRIKTCNTKSEVQLLRGEIEPAIRESRAALGISKGVEALRGQHLSTLGRIRSLQVELGDYDAAIETFFAMLEFDAKNANRYKDQRKFIESLGGNAALSERGLALCRRIEEFPDVSNADRFWLILRESKLLCGLKRYDEALSNVDRSYGLAGVDKTEIVNEIFHIRLRLPGARDPESTVAWDWFADTIRTNAARYNYNAGQTAGLWSRFGYEAFHAFRPDQIVRARDEILKLKKKPGHYAHWWANAIHMYEDWKTFPIDESQIHFPTNVTEFGVEMKSECYPFQEFPFDENDATECLQQALDSGATTVVIENIGKPWRIRGVNLRSNQNILIQKGVVITGDEASQKGNSGSTMFNLSEVKNVAIIGLGDSPADVYIGKYPDAKTRNKLCTKEGGSGLSLGGCRNIIVRNLTLANNSCDGISFGGLGVPNRNIYVENVVLDHNYRQASSICSGDGIYFKKVAFQNTLGGEPMMGIDLEPTYEIQGNANIYLFDCTFANNAGGGLTFSSSSYYPVTLYAKRCIFEPHGHSGLLVFARSGVYLPPRAKAPSKLVFEESVFKTNHGGSPVKFSASSFFDVLFKNCLFTDIRPPDPERKGGTPIHFCLDREYNDPEYTRNRHNEGEVVFEGCRTEGFGDVPVVSFRDLTGHYSVTKIRGQVEHNGKTVDMSQYVHMAPDDDREEIAAFDPALYDFPADPFPASAPDKGPTTMDIVWKTPWYVPTPVVTAIYKEGDHWKTKKIPQWRKAIGLKGHAVAYSPKGGDNNFRVTPAAGLPEGTRSFYFEVPAGAGECTFKIDGEADVFNAKGELVQECKKNWNGYNYVTVKPASDAAEIWSVTVKKNAAIKFFAPLSGIIAEKPEWLPRRRAAAPARD